MAHSRSRCALLAAFAAAPLVRGLPSGAGSCNVEEVHGTHVRGGGNLQLLLPSSYDSSQAGSAVSVTLSCVSAECAASASNGFLLSPLDASGAPAGTLTALSPGTRAVTDPLCSSARTHASPLATSSWSFSWAPGGTTGVVTWHSAVVVGFYTSYLLTACLPDAAAGTTPAPSVATEHAGHGRRRGLRMDGMAMSSETAPPSSAALDLLTVCTPGNASAAQAQHSHAGHGGMASAWFVSADWSAEAVVPGAVINSPRAFAAVLFVSFALAALTSTLSAANLPGEIASERRGEGWAGRRQARITAGVVARNALHYAAMLLAMTFSLWVLLALAAGHGASYLGRAAQRQRLAPAHSSTSVLKR